MRASNIVQYTRQKKAINPYKTSKLHGNVVCQHKSHGNLFQVFKTDIRNVEVLKYSSLFVGRSSSSNCSQENDLWTPDGDRTCNLQMTGETL